MCSSLYLKTAGSKNFRTLPSRTKCEVTFLIHWLYLRLWRHQLRQICVKVQTGSLFRVHCVYPTLIRFTCLILRKLKPIVPGAPIGCLHVSSGARSESIGLTRYAFFALRLPHPNKKIPIRKAQNLHIRRAYGLPPVTSPPLKCLLAQPHPLTMATTTLLP